jgi:hypothetical protein
MGLGQATDSLTTMAGDGFSYKGKNHDAVFQLKVSDSAQAD